jgi:hypothetical protein
MGRTFSINGREEKCIYFFIGKPEGKIYLKDIDVSEYY